MASVHRVKESRFWHGLVSLPGGKRIFRSTGQTDEELALKVAKEWERVAKGDLPHSAEQARRVMADIVTMVMGETTTRATCRQYVERWLKATETTVAAATMAFYRSSLESWVSSLGPRADKPLDGIQREDIVAWRDAEAKRVRAKTANHRLRALRVLFKAAAGEGFVSVNPLAGIKPVKSEVKEKRKRRPFAREELAKVLELADEAWKIMTLAGLETGQRLGDIVRMDWSELDLAKRTWRVVTGKTGHALRIPLGSELAAVLKARAAAKKSNSGPVFPEQLARLGKNGEVGLLSNDFAYLLYRVGLRRYSPHDRIAKNGTKADLVAGGSDRREQQELSFHSLRHTARTWLEEMGQPKAVIDALVGHVGETGKIYTSVGEDALRAAAEALAAARK
jgi:integrase